MLGRKFALREFESVFKEANIDDHSYFKLYSAFQIGKGAETWAKVVDRFDPIPHQLIITAINGFLAIDKTKATILCTQYLSSKTITDVEWEELARIYCFELLESPELGIEYLQSHNVKSKDAIIRDLDALISKRISPILGKVSANVVKPHQATSSHLSKLFQLLLNLPIATKATLTLFIFTLVMQRLLKFKFGQDYYGITKNRIWKSIQLALNPKF